MDPLSGGLVGLRFDPMGGGQFKQALKAMIEAERQPIKSIEGRKQREEARMKLFQEFKGKFNGIDKSLADLTDFKKFREYKVDMGDGEKLMSVTIDKDRANPGSYEIQIDQLSRRTSVISNGFASADEPVLGIGFVVVELANGEVAEIYVDESNSSLRGVANLINSEQDNPIQASVIKDISDPDKPWKLIMSSKQDGLDDFVNFPELYFLDGQEDFYFSDQRDAQNALVTIDGFEIEAESNNVKDFIQGVNVQFKQARPDEPFTLTISEDTKKIGGKLKSLVDQINGILEFINAQNKVDEKSDTRANFTGDTSLQTVEYRLRNILHEGFPVGDPNTDEFRFVRLNEMGIEFDKAGKLEFKEDRFEKALSGDFEGVSEAITGEYGFAKQLRGIIQGYTRTSDGLLAIREGGMRSRIKQLDEDIAAKERRIEIRTAALTEQFARLQSTLAGMQKQQQYLSATLGGGGGDMLSQLMGSAGG